ncbi:hypothetical protein MTO96_025838 [Rhipicephalus appendiculatus]
MKVITSFEDKSDDLHFKAPVGEVPVDQGPTVAADEDDKNSVEGFAAKGGDTSPVAQGAIGEHDGDDHDRYSGNEVESQAAAVEKKAAGEAAKVTADMEPACSLRVNGLAKATRETDPGVLAVRKKRFFSSYSHTSWIVHFDLAYCGP